jgi:3-hydroxyacyl-CoA dehydrogenase
MSAKTTLADYAAREGRGKERCLLLLNSLLVPWLIAAMSLAVQEIADPQDVDRTWMIATGASMGPFAILDVIGLRTPMQILGARAQQGDETALRQSEWLDREYVKRNRLGVETGEGFYPASTGWRPVQAQSATVLGSRQSRTVRLTAADPSADSAEARRSQVER